MRPKTLVSTVGALPPRQVWQLNRVG